MKYKVTQNDLKIIEVRSDISKLLKIMDAENVCEVGVRKGEHFSNLLIPSLKHAVAVDIWKETGVRSQNDNCYSQEELDKFYQTVLDMSIKNRAVQVVRDFSVEASKLFDDHYFDFVYLDADHTEESTWKDINAWWSKVRSGGVLAGHDYSAAIPTTKDGVVLKFGVIESVNRFVKQNNLNLYVDKAVSWFLIKP